MQATLRNTTGNGPARQLRRSGKTPGVLYGRETAPVSLAVDTHDFEQIINKYNINQVLIKLDVTDGGFPQSSVMIKELQVHPLTRYPLHVDFYVIDMKRKITVSIPVVTTGKAAGVEEGGILQVVRRDLDVNCLPGMIPEHIKIDISHLQIGDAVHIGEIELEGDVEFLDDESLTVVTVLSPQVEEEPEEEELEGVEGEEGAETEEGEAPEAGGEEA
ncbi:MAG TPA: 50S ribosomal protein L25 [Desulfobacterales bacterium]